MSVRNRELQLPFDAGLSQGLQEYARRVAVWARIAGGGFLALAVLWLSLSYVPSLFPFAAAGATMAVLWYCFRLAKAISIKQNAPGRQTGRIESEVEPSRSRCVITLLKTNRGNVTITVRGSIVLGPETSRLQDVLAAVIGEYEHVMIDLNGVKRIDAAGLGVLVSATAAARSKGSRVVLQNLTPQVQELAKLIGLLPRIGEADDSASDLAS